MTSQSRKYIISLYNLSQLLSWIYILILLFLNLSQGNITVLTDANLFKTLKLVQELQYLDVFFALIGLSSTKVIPSFVQVTARNVVVWWAFPFALKSHFALLAMVCWCFAEIIRYSTYINDSFALGLNWLKILRYNAFILLYPAGVTGEFLSARDAKDHLTSEKMDPNLQLFGFDLHVSTIAFLKGFMLIIYPGLAVLYSHMLKLRKRFYQKEKSKQKPKKA